MANYLFYLGGTNSDLSLGNSFNKYLEETTETAGTIQEDVPGGTTYTGYAVSRAGVIENDNWGTTNIAVNMQLTNGSPQVEVSIIAHRLSSTGTILESSAQTAVQTANVTNPVFNISHTWNAGSIDDRLAIEYIFVNTHNSKTNSVAVETGTTATEVDSGIVEPSIPQFSGSSEAGINVNSESLGKKSTSINSESTVYTEGRSREIFSNGIGTENYPYVITTIEQFQSLSDYFGNPYLYFELGNDIDASDTINWNGGAGFLPIEGPNYPTSFNTADLFNGKLNGKGFKISNIFIETDGKFRIGIFSSLGQFGIIHDLVIDNATVNSINSSTNGTQIGILTGYNGGLGYQDTFPNAEIVNTRFYNIKIMNSTVNITAQNTEYPTRCGILQAINSNSFVDEYIHNVALYNNTINFSTPHRIIGGGFGDISAVQDSNIGIYYNNCYVKNLTITGTSDNYFLAGGFNSYYAPDFPFNIYFEDCYTSYLSFVNTGAGNTYLSSFISAVTANANLYPTDIYTCSESSNVTQSEATDLTIAQMQEESNLAFDFTNVWTTDSTVNDGFPILQVFYISVISGSSEAIINIDIEGAFKKLVSDYSEILLNLSTEQSGYKQSAGSSESAIAVDVEGDYSVNFVGSSEVSILLATDVEGIKKSRSPPTDTTVDIYNESSGNKHCLGAAEESLEIYFESDYYKTIFGNSESLIVVDTDSLGNKLSIGLSESPVSINAQGSGEVVLPDLYQATANGEIDKTGGPYCTERGFVFGTTSLADPGNTAPGLTSYDRYVSETGSFGEGLYSLTLTDLEEGTYYVRAYALNSAGYSYGAEDTFSITAGSSGSSETAIEISLEQSGNKLSSESSETIIELNTESQGYKNIVAGAETAITIDLEGLGKQIAKGSSETAITIDLEGLGKQIAKGYSEITLEVYPEGSQNKIASGSSETAIAISEEGLGVQTSKYSSETAIIINEESLGYKKVSGSSETTIGIPVEGNGNKKTSGDNQTLVEIISEGLAEQGIIYKSGSGETALKIVPEATGAKNTASNSESYINIYEESEGTKRGKFSSQSEVIIDEETSSTKYTFSSSESIVEIIPEYNSLKIIAGQSQTDLQVSNYSVGQKEISINSEIELYIDTEKLGFKTISSYSENNIKLITESSSIKTNYDESEIIVEIDLQGLGASGELGIGRIEVTSFEGTTNKLMLITIHNNLHLSTDGVNKLSISNTTLELINGSVNKVVIIS